MMKIFCAIVGEAGGVFEVNIDAGLYVSALKKAIKEENEHVMVPFRKLQLFMAKKNDAWLRADDIAVIRMRSGSIPRQLKELLHEEISSADKIGDVFGDNPPEKMIHVLVVTPPQAPPQGALAPVVRIPECIPLDNSDQNVVECSLDRWEAGEVRDVPLIWQFMQTLGGCTKTKKIFWRNEESKSRQFFWNDALMSLLMLLPSPSQP